MPPNWSGPPDYEEAYPEYVDKFVDRFSPGVVKEVDSSHYIKAAVPERIAEELEKIIDSASA